MMPPLSTMRQKGFVGDVTLGICSREDSLIPTIEMFIPVSNPSGGWGATVVHDAHQRFCRFLHVRGNWW